MTTRYRVEYALKTHRRDQFIEWIKGLLAVPFVLHSQPQGIFHSGGTPLPLEHMAEEAARRYAEIMRDVEVMIDDHIALQRPLLLQQQQQALPEPPSSPQAVGGGGGGGGGVGASTSTTTPTNIAFAHHQHQHHQHSHSYSSQQLPGQGQYAAPPPPSKLKLLVPTVGPFFTRLPLEAAFKYQDRKRYISSRRFVSPSFNDVRLLLNSAQLMACTTYSSLQLATFDGDVTLYDDGGSLAPDSPLVPRLLDLLRKNVRVGIVTAAGYTTADRYHARLHGLLDALADPSHPSLPPAVAALAAQLTPTQRRNLLVMGGEANYLFSFDPTPAAAPHHLRAVPRSEWLTPEMAAWHEADIAALLDDAEAALRECVRGLALPAVVMRKDRAVGIIPEPEGARIPRESLEETVLVVQRLLENSLAGRAKRVPFCAFNGGRDVFVDIGDKSWGVNVCQRYFEQQDAAAASSSSSSSSSSGHRRGAAPLTIRPENTLHVGDQFLSAGANDFRARSVGTTAWIASPEETVELLDELADLMGKKMA